MESEPGAESSPHDAGLAELVRRIQVGDQAAIRDLHLMFSAGIEFLVGRRLQRPPFPSEVTGVIEAVVREVRNSPSPQTVNLLRVVTKIIGRLFPPALAHIEAAADSTGQTSADSVLAESTPLEHEILTRYYALGEPVDTIRISLGIGVETVEQVLADARAEFFRRKGRRAGSS
jgi:hypothetical protein